MGNLIKVGMADLKVGRSTDVLTTLGLGSCIGLTFYDPQTKIGGLVHYMLPDSTKIKNHSNIAKFADTGIRELLRQVLQSGAEQRRLVAKIAGGACMFEISANTALGNVGKSNAEAAKEILKELRIPLIAEDTGLNYGRTVELNCENGEYLIKAVGKFSKVI
ncbi:MAG: chemotaxis protein CheD [Agathobacter sp.]|nr:chemotaxis protein CheD [Agathobacter sp.]